MQACLYGGAHQDGQLGDVWMFDSERLAWDCTQNPFFGGLSGVAKAWHAAAVLDSTVVCPATVQRHTLLLVDDSSGSQGISQIFLWGP
jgi:hypothetical protein